MQPVVHSIKRSSGRVGQPVVTPTPRNTILAWKQQCSYSRTCLLQTQSSRRTMVSCSYSYSICHGKAVQPARGPEAHGVCRKWPAEHISCNDLELPRLKATLWFVPIHGE